jgi:hypothetical protein
MSQAKDEKNIYPTLAEAIRVRGYLRRHRGKRFRNLRIYRVETGWCFTKMTKGQIKP